MVHVTLHLNYIIIYNKGCTLVVSVTFLAHNASLGLDVSEF